MNCVGGSLETTVCNLKVRRYGKLVSRRLQSRLGRHPRDNSGRACRGGSGGSATAVSTHLIAFQLPQLSAALLSLSNSHSYRRPSTAGLQDRTLPAEGLRQTAGSARTSLTRKTHIACCVLDAPRLEPRLRCCRRILCLGPRCSCIGRAHIVRLPGRSQTSEIRWIPVIDLLRLRKRQPVRP